MLAGLAGIADAREVPSVAGLYLIEQMEMAGGLDLRVDGTFRYSFDYGSVSEEAVGRWSMDGADVLLTTDPMPPPGECDRGFYTACFRSTRLVRDGEDFILYRWDAKIVLKPSQPLPR